jgi:hypothetical protein
MTLRTLQRDTAVECRMLHRIRVLAVSVTLVASLVACKKAEQKPAAGTAAPLAVASGASAPPAQAPVEPTEATAPSDAKYAKKDLSEDKIQRFIKSLGEGKNMFAPPMGSLDEANKFMAEQEAFAKKYGFKDGPDYMETTGRIDLGLMMVAMADQTAAMRASVVKSIADSEAALAAPNTPADTKAELTETIADAKKHLAEMDAEAKSFNAEDLALIAKFKDQIQAAETANQAAQAANKPKK